MWEDSPGMVRWQSATFISSNLEDTLHRCIASNDELCLLAGLFLTEASATYHIPGRTLSFPGFLGKRDT